MFTALVTTRSITSIISFIISSFVVNVCLWVRVWPIARCCVPTNESKWTASTPPPPWPPPQLAIRLPHVARSELINLCTWVRRDLLRWPSHPPSPRWCHLHTCSSPRPPLELRRGGDSRNLVCLWSWLKQRGSLSPMVSDFVLRPGLSVYCRW